MAKVIGQRWEIYGYEAVKGIVLKKGEKIVVNQTPTLDGFGNTVVQLVSSDGKKTIEAIYNDWKNGVGSPFRTAANQDVIDSAETAARMLGDNDTLIAAEEYTDQEIIKNKLAVNEWLAPVKTVSQIPKTGLDSTRNYLIKAVADPVKSGVYQAIAGWTNEPVWALYDDTVDFVDEQEMAAIVEAEAQTRHDADQNLQDQINMLAPEGLENLPELISAKLSVVTRDTSLTGDGTSSSPLGVNFPPENDAPIADQKYALPYKYTSAATAFNLNNYRTPGEYTLSSPSSSSTNFPSDYGTLSSSYSAFLKVMPFYLSGTTSHAVRQELYKRGTNDGWSRYSTSATGWSGWVKMAINMEAMTNLLFPVGSLIIQYPNEQTPIERGLPGSWLNWKGRVEIYGLSTSLPTSTDMPAYNQNEAASIAANAYRLVTHADGDQEIYQAIAAISLTDGKIGPFNPVKWRPLTEVSTSGYAPFFVARKSVQAWTATDLVMRASITYNGISYLVSARYGLAGKFLSFNGGNRPTFETGAAHKDMIRNITGSTGAAPINSKTGAFYGGSSAGLAVGNVVVVATADLDVSRVVPTGPENSPRTLSAAYWRRVS